MACTGYCQFCWNPNTGTWIGGGNTCSAGCMGCPGAPANPPGSSPSVRFLSCQGKTQSTTIFIEINEAAQSISLGIPIGWALATVVTKAHVLKKKKKKKKTK